MKKRIQIFIDHDIIFRHFIRSSAFADLEKQFEVQYVLPKDPKRVTVDPKESGLKTWIEIEVDRPRTGQMRECCKVASIQRSWTSRDFAPFRELNRNFIFDKGTYRRMSFYAIPGIFQWYRRRLLKRLGEYTQMRQAIEAFKPDLIIHPTVLEGVFVADLCMLTKKMGIPFVALMNSWDNPSTKAQILESPDHLAVWGEQTLQHAKRFLNMKPDQLKIMGAAQFTVYSGSPQKSREQVLLDAQIDPKNKLIIYAGSSKGVNEIRHLRVIDEQIEAGKLPGFKVLYRPHPWRDPSHDEADFFDVAWKHVTMDPSMRHAYNSIKGAGQKINITNYEDTYSVLSACDLLVSNMSTILLEAAILGKPIVSLATQEDVVSNPFLETTMRMIYFKELIEKLDLPICRDSARLADVIAERWTLSQTPGWREKQIQSAEFFVVRPPRTYSVRLAEWIGALTAGAPANA